MFDLSVYYLFLQYFDTVGWVFWPVKTVSHIIYTVLAGDVKHCSIQSNVLFDVVDLFVKHKRVCGWLKHFSESTNVCEHKRVCCLTYQNHAYGWVCCVCRWLLGIVAWSLVAQSRSAVVWCRPPLVSVVKLCQVSGHGRVKVGRQVKVGSETGSCPLADFTTHASVALLHAACCSLANIQKFILYVK